MAANPGWLALTFTPKPLEGGRKAWHTFPDDGCHNQEGHMAIDKDRDVSITYTENIERNLTLEFPKMAKVLGISQKALAEIIDDGEEYEPSEEAMQRLRVLGDISDQEFTVDEVGEA
jgi:hypothetical protein